MDLQNLFYLVAVIFFISLIGLVVYIAFLINNIKKTVEIFVDKTKNAAENLNTARYSLKAGLLRMFLTFLGERGGDKNE